MDTCVHYTGEECHTLHLFAPVWEKERYRRPFAQDEYGQCVYPTEAARLKPSTINFELKSTWLTRFAQTVLTGSMFEYMNLRKDIENIFPSGVYYLSSYIFDVGEDIVEQVGFNRKLTSTQQMERVSGISSPRGKSLNTNWLRFRISPSPRRTSGGAQITGAAVHEAPRAVCVQLSLPTRRFSGQRCQWSMWPVQCSWYAQLHLADTHSHKWIICHIAPHLRSEPSWG